MRATSGAILLLAGLLAGPPLASAGIRTDGRRSTEPPQHTPVGADLLARCPVSFEVNRGQCTEGVSFLARAEGWAAAILPDGAAFHLRPGGGPAATMHLRGAGPGAWAEGLRPLPSRTNYLLGNDPSRWLRGVPHFGEVLARGAVPGVALRWRGLPGGRVRYDLEIEAGTGAGAAVLEFEGARSLEVAADGSLLVDTEQGVLRHGAPRAWQEAGGRREPLPCAFVVEARSVRFAMAGRDPSRPAIIDPTIEVSTFYAAGVSGFQQACGCALDATGDVIQAGFANTGGFGTSGAFQKVLGGGYDAFVVKFPRGSSSYAWFTYLGGSADDRAYAVQVDAAGSAFAAGFTGSSNFPLKNEARGFAGNNDAFLARLDPDGAGLGYSTCFGGAAFDYAYGVALDREGAAWIGGSTSSDDLPLAGPLQSTRQGGSDAFLARFDPTGRTILFSTYWGGSGGGTELVRALACAEDGTLWASGQTGSTDFPTRFPVQGSLAGGYDGFLLGLAADGSAALYSSFLGGSGTDDADGIAVDWNGDVFVTGKAGSSDFPTASALQSSSGGGDDVFVYKLNAANLTTAFSTYFGGSGNDFGAAVAIDGEGYAVVTGTTESSNFPKAAATDVTLGGARDMFLLRLKGDGSAAVFSTYHGGTSGDDGLCMAADGGGATAGGGTRSSDFPAVNGRGETFAGSSAGALVAFSFLPEPFRSLHATALSLDGANLAWTDTHAGAFGAELQRRSDGGTFAALATLSAGATTYADSGLVEDAWVQYRVRATSAGGNAGWSNRLWVLTPLQAPGGVAVAEVRNRAVTLSWQDLSTVETGYAVLRRAGAGGAFVEVASRPAGAISWTDTGVLPETSYQFFVRTKAASGRGADSSILPVTTPPEDPGSFSAVVQNDIEVRLGWVDHSLAETGFEIQRRDDGAGGAFATVATVGPSVPLYTEAALLPEHAYSWRVRAVNGNGGSEWTQVLSRSTAPAAPTGLVAARGVDGTVVLSWADASGAEADFLVERQVLGEAEFTGVATPAPDSTSSEDEAPPQETTLTYRVRARNADGLSRSSTAAPVVIPALLLIAKAALKPAKGTKPAALVASGTFDRGPGAVNLAGAAEVGIGGTVLSLDGFETLSGGALLRHEEGGLRLDLKVSLAGTSAVSFALAVEGGAAASLDPEGLLALSFRWGTFRCAGAVDLAGGKLATGKGAWPWESFRIAVTKFRAAIADEGDQSFSLSAAVPPAAEPPASAPDVRLSLGGGFTATLPGSQFTAKKGKFTYKGLLSGTWSVTLDSRKGTLTMKATHLDLGHVAFGPVPFRIDLSVGDLRYLDTPVLVSDAKKIGF